MGLLLGTPGTRCALCLHKRTVSVSVPGFWQCTKTILGAADSHTAAVHVLLTF